MIFFFGVGGGGGGGGVGKEAVVFVFYSVQDGRSSSIPKIRI